MKHHYPPGPSLRYFGLEIISKVRQDRQMDFLMEMATYGDITHATLGPKHIYVLFHPEHIHQILVDEPHKVNKSSIQKRGHMRVAALCTLAAENNADNTAIVAHS